ncbi:amidohydrolase family protein [Novosphingobium malaysiense]|uniref:amidohydrolase family protein n=1 Tax=Novosphingobium malaysiense TaxID=1348853 RepID=UPI00068AEE18|nr:amidohydrolase family protein [Novosphingobium malaysiense]
MIVDCQVHAYEADNPARPWVNVLPGPPSVTGEELVAAMDGTGVDAAILVSAWTMYRYDWSYAVSVGQAYPERFALVAPVDISSPAVAETIDEWAGIDGAVGIRIFEFPEDPDHPGLHSAIAAAQRHSLTVNLLTFDHHGQVATLARTHSDCQFAIDHMGVRPPRVPPLHANPFAKLPQVLEYAAFDNIAIKISGVGTMSAEGYPFADLWEPMERVFDAFGLDRCMWGSDWTRAVEFLTYQDAVDAIRLSNRLSETERAKLMGGSLQKIYGWSPPDAN